MNKVRLMVEIKKYFSSKFPDLSPKQLLLIQDIVDKSYDLATDSVLKRPLTNEVEFAVVNSIKALIGTILLNVSQR